MKWMPAILLIIALFFVIPGYAETHTDTGGEVSIESSEPEADFAEPFPPDEENMDVTVDAESPDEELVDIAADAEAVDAAEASDEVFPDEDQLDRAESEAGATEDLAENPSVEADRPIEQAKTAPPKPDQAKGVESKPMSPDYESLRNKRVALDREFQDLEAERKKLIEEKDSLKTQKEVQAYNRKSEALNARIKDYENRWNQYNGEVGAFNSQVKKDIERRIMVSAQANMDTNYEAFAVEYQESLDNLAGDSSFNIDKGASLEEQRAVISRYKDEITKEYQELMVERERINKEKKQVKTREEIEALNKRTTALNEKIIQYGEKSAAFDLELRNFNERLAKSVLKADE